MAWKDRLNNFLYFSRVPAQFLRRVVVKIGALVALGLVVYLYGFDLEPESQSFIFGFLDVFFGLYALNYLVKLLYSFQRISFIKDNPGETITTAIILFNGVSKYLISIVPGEIFLESIGVEEYEVMYRSAVTFFILLIITLDFISAFSHDRFLSIRPSFLLIASFFGLSLIGAILLLMPRMTVHEGSFSPIDALFTSVSATCVTGLVVVDTATFFTIRGKLVILMLMQLGGIGIVTFATFFAMLVGKGIGIRQQSMVQDVLSEESLFSAKGLLRRVFSITLLIEALGAFMIFFSYDANYEFSSISQRLFHSIFHAVSAFCNAGFSLYSDSYYSLPLRYSYVQHIIISVLVVLGGLGFSTIQDLFSPTALRKRLNNPWIDWKMSTKVAVYTTVVLVIFGALGFFILELNTSLEDKSLSSSIITSFFQSITTRTAGFNTVAISELRVPTLILFIFLMFIGANPGSTGGGIKTSTFLLILISVFATIRGRDTIELGRRSLPGILFYKALTVFAFAATFNLVMIFCLSISEEGFSIFEIAFEQVSAFATVGLSMGITSSLSDFGKILITTSMFFGRIGTLTLALALAGARKKGKFRYPSAHLMVG